MKKALLALLFGSAAVAAQAQPLYYSWTYTGYEYANTYNSREWYDGVLMSGTFKGEDLNGDNVIAINEISSFYMRGEHFAIPNVTRGTCEGAYSCGISRFSYTLGDNHVRFSGGSSTYFEGMYSSSTSFQTLDLSRPVIVRINDFPVDEYSYITPETKFTITAAVPEPSTYLMLGTGLALLGLGLRRRRN